MQGACSTRHVHVGRARRGACRADEAVRLKAISGATDKRICRDSTQRKCVQRLYISVKQHALLEPAAHAGHAICVHDHMIGLSAVVVVHPAAQMCWGETRGRACSHAVGYNHQTVPVLLQLLRCLSRLCLLSCLGLCCVSLAASSGVRPSVSPAMHTQHGTRRIALKCVWICSVRLDRPMKRDRHAQLQQGGLERGQAGREGGRWQCTMGAWV
jgi:hypothetical protein